MDRKGELYYQGIYGEWYKVTGVIKAKYKGFAPDGKLLDDSVEGALELNVSGMDIKSTVYLGSGHMELVGRKEYE